MKNKEKVIVYIWLCSLALILFIGIVLCLQRPPAEIIAAQQEVITLSSKIRAHYRNRPDYWGLNGNEVINKKLVAFKISNNQLYNKLDKPIVIGGDINGTQVMPGSHSYKIVYYDLNKKECEELASFRWQEEDKLGLLSMTIQSSEGTYEFSWGDKGLPLSKGRAKQYCKDKNRIMWSFE